MNEPGRKRASPTEWAIGGIILGAIFLVLWPVARDFRGPRGDPIPKQSPDEANRIRHPAGFSIVVPPNWGSHGLTDPELFPGQLVLAPLVPGPYARRSEALIDIRHLGQDRPSGVESLYATTFQGQEAYEHMKVVREDTFDDPAWSEYELIFRRGDEWFLARYGIAEERTAPPDIIRQYFDTLRWDSDRRGHEGKGGREEAAPGGVDPPIRSRGP